MIVATFRPASFAASHPAAWRVVQEILAHFHATRIELSRFNEHDVGEYLRMQGRWHDVDSAVPWFYERTLGNPSFLVHLFRHAAASGALRHENGAWEFDPDQKSIAVPLTLRQLIQSHMATLDEPSTRLLETASIVGYEFAAAAVAAASEEHVHSVEERLRDLSHQGELISRAGELRWPDGTASTVYRFQHAYQRQVLYDNVPAGIRTALHLRIARRLENAFGDQGEEIAAELAVHFECGRDYRAAVEQYIRAHDNAIFRGAQHEALACAESAIRALRQLPDTQARDIDELGLRLRVWAALMNVNTMVDPTAEAAMDKAVTLAEKIDGAPLSNITLMWASRVRLMAGETRAVWTLTEQLLARARASNVGMATAINQQAMILLFKGETERAASLASEALQIAVEHGLAPAGLDVQQLNLKTLAWACWIGGDIPRLQSTIEAFLRRAEALNEPIAKAFAYGRCAPLLEYLGSIDRSMSLLKSAANLVEKHGMTQVKRWTDAVEGWLLSRHGAASAGVARLSDAIDILNQQGMKIWTPWFYAWLSEALLLNGEPDKSLRAADDGLERSAEMSVPGYDPELLRLRGEALLRLSRTDEAEVAMRHAHALATSHRSKTFELRAALSLARMATNGLNTGDVVGLLSHALLGFAADVWTPDLEAVRAMLASS